MFQLICLAAAIACFTLDALNVKAAIKWTSAGFAFVTASFLPV